MVASEISVALSLATVLVAVDHDGYEWLQGVALIESGCHQHKLQSIMIYMGGRKECYFHPDFEYLAIAERNKCERLAMNALRRIAGVPIATE